MRMEKKNDRRWRQRIRRDVVTSRAPNPPYKCAECPRHILSLQFVAGISLCELHDPLVHENKGKPPKSQNVSISFAPYLRSTVPQNGTKRSYSRSLQEVLTGERMFPKGAILLFGSFPNKCPAPGRPSQSTTRPDQGRPLLQTGFLHVCSRTS